MNNPETEIRRLARDLQQDPSNPELNSKLADAYAEAAGKGGENSERYCRLAMECLRKLSAADPGNETLHDKIIYLANRTDVLDELALEYSEKLKNCGDGPEAEIYRKCIKKIEALVSIRDIRRIFVSGKGHAPSRMIRAAIDLFLLPSALALFIMSLYFDKLKPLLPHAVILFGFYFCSRVLLHRLGK